MTKRIQKCGPLAIATLGAGVAVCWAATFAPFATSAPSGSAAARGRIAWKSFPRSEHDTWSIYAANLDGSGRRRLTHPRAGVHDDLPDWSPDGSNIVFVRIFQPDSNSTTIPDEIMRVDADGTSLRQVGSCTGHCVVNDDPQYSPDGRRIVYTRLMRARPSGALVLGVWVMNANGTNPHQITQLSTPARSEDHEPAWSPDGKNIVFTRLNDSATPVNHQALFIAGSDGSRPRRITPWKLNAGGPNWSPNGSRILFQSYRDCPCRQTSQVTPLLPMDLDSTG